MKTDVIYKPQKMHALLQDLSPRFYLPAEFPSRRPDEHVAEMLAQAQLVSDSELGAFSLSIRSAELDSLLLYLPEASQLEAACILRILRHRSNRRILALFWPFFQYYYENPNVMSAAKTILEHLPETDKATLLARNLGLFVSGDGFSAMIDRLAADVVPLSVFAAGEQLVTRSPLAVRLFEQYFSVCGKEGFLLNAKRLLRLFGITSRETAEEILKNYLLHLNREEYLTDINLYILDRWGEPFKSVEWTSIPMDLRRKFADWNAYRRLAEHFTRNRRKLRILSDLIPHILHIRLSDDKKYMAADFGEFVIVDANELSSYSYLIKKSLYERLSDKIEESGLEGVMYSMERIVSARDFIIEEAEDAFMQLEYNELGKLYIIDMLKILLKLEPDLRPSKSIINKKRRKG